MMRESYDVSILVPVYNVEKQIARCVRSLFEQDFLSIEYIFVDDASPDNSIAVLKQILEEYPERKGHVKILRHSQNGGLWKARTTALTAARGEYIWWIDSDDYIAPGAVKKLYSATCLKNADLVTCNFADVFADGAIRERIRHVPETKQLFLEGILSGNLQPCVCLMFCKRKIYTEYNILPVPFVNFGEDYALTPRLLYKVNTIVSIPDVLYFYVHDNDSSYCSVWKNGYIQEREQTLDVLKKFFHNADPVYVECITKNIIRTKCHFYRMYANSRKNNSDLKKINEWHTEIPLKTLLRSAQLPYKPIVVLGFLHLDFLLRCYVISCRFIYRNLMRFFS